MTERHSPTHSQEKEDLCRVFFLRKRYLNYTFSRKPEKEDAYVECIYTLGVAGLLEASVQGRGRSKVFILIHLFNLTNFSSTGKFKDEMTMIFTCPLDYINK